MDNQFNYKLQKWLNDDSRTIEDIYEPYLIQKGLLERTPRGQSDTLSEPSSPPE